MVPVAGFAHRRMLASVAGDVSNNDPLRRNAEVSKMQLKFNLLVAQLCSATLECGSGRSLAEESVLKKFFFFRALLATSKDEFKLPEGQIPQIPKEEVAVTFKRAASNTKVSHL